MIAASNNARCQVMARMTPTETTSSFRFDIQALRALAVMLVLVYHVWPDVLPAGYVGVDVFFVISGFLITGMLCRELQREGRILFLRFYLRRFRRLMPAASLVIIVTMLLSFLLEPGFRRPGTAMEGVASALYWQNWLLAWRATDYLEAESSLGPLTHYWSLSIEEQYYLVWPLALAAVGTLARRRGWRLRTTALCLISLASAGSLTASATLAYRGLPEVYFVTHARIWELGLGALLALTPLPHIRVLTAHILAALALAMIVLSAFLIPQSARFPGLIALAPTVSTAVFIFAGVRLEQRSWLGLPASRPVQAIGDASYSVYLWHWPLVYFVTLGQAHEPGLSQGLGLVVASLLAGWLSWRMIEEPFRHRRDSAGMPGSMAGAATALGLVVSVAAGGVLYAHSRAVIDAWKGLTPGGDHPGAMALTGYSAIPPRLEPEPPIAALKEDMPVIYGRDCHVGLREVTPKLCVLEEGPEGAPVVVVAGDSHAANWVPALHAAAAQAGWTLISTTKSACSLTLESTEPGVHAPELCTAWSRKTLEKLRELAPDVVVLGRSRRGSDYESDRSDRWVPGLVQMLDEVLMQLDSVANHVAVMSDTPKLPVDPADCLAATERECTTSLADSLDRPDALLEAASGHSSITIIDLRHLICPKQQCPAVIGNIVVWRDSHHLTATYARSLAPEMMRRIGALTNDR